MSTLHYDNADAVQVLKQDIFLNKHALVTGAGSGIGQGITLRLLELGMDVYGIGRRQEALENTAQKAKNLKGRFRYICCNIRESEILEKIVLDIGNQYGIDLLVNNAGGQFFAPAHEITSKGWNAVIDTNLNAVFWLTRLAYPFLKKTAGSVINLSLSGIDRGSMGIAHSIAARAGVLGMTRTLALEWARDQIRLNCIGPGVVITDALAQEAARPMLESLIQATPMGRGTRIEEVAELVAFLASPAGALMTGQLIQIDGAAHLGPGLHMLNPQGTT